MLVLFDELYSRGDMDFQIFEVLRIRRWVVSDMQVVTQARSTVGHNS